jgi:hypothetical protein
MNYRYSLEKYSKNSLHTFPACGREKSFTRYVDSETGHYLDDDVGKCHHRKSCDYHRPPRQYFADNPSARNNNSGKRRSLKSISVKVEKPSVFDCIDPDVFKRTLTGFRQNNFVLELFSRFDSQKVTETLAKYFVGTWTDGRTVFWQIDERKRIRTGKLLRFDRKTLTRQKLSTNWVHDQLKRNGQLGEDFALKQCLFGEHLLMSAAQEKPIGLVESEKNAIIADLFLPGFIWLSVGSNSSFKVAKINPVKNRRIVLFPDGEAFEDWTKRARDLELQGFEIMVSNLIEQHVPAELKGKGFDIADALIYANENQIKEKPNRQTGELSVCSLCGGKLMIDERKTVKLYYCPADCPFEHYILKSEKAIVKNEMFASLEQWQAQAYLDALEERESILIEQGYGEAESIELAEKHLLPGWLYDYEKDLTGR